MENALFLLFPEIKNSKINSFFIAKLNFDTFGCILESINYIVNEKEFRVGFLCNNTNQVLNILKKKITSDITLNEVFDEVYILRNIKVKNIYDSVTKKDVNVIIFSKTNISFFKYKCKYFAGATFHIVNNKVSIPFVYEVNKELFRSSIFEVEKYGLRSLVNKFNLKEVVNFE